MKKIYYMAVNRKRLFSLALVIPLLTILVLATPALAAPVVTIAPATGVAGTELTVTGTVFDSYKGDTLHIFFDDDEISGSPIEVPQTGEFTISFVVPAGTTPGRHWISIKSEVDSTSVLAENFFVVEQTDITLTAIDGPVGTEITINGKGFYAGRTVNLYYYNIVGDPISSVTASHEGRFSQDFVIPASTGGVHKITASNDEGDSAEVEFEVVPALSLNLASAGPKELLTARGTGYGYRSDVNITLSAINVATAKTDDYGNFEIEFNVPDIQPNAYDIKAQDKLGNVDICKFTVTAGASLSETIEAVGSQLTVKGSGFNPNGPVDIKYDGQTVATATADNNGGFTVTFSVPASEGGDHVIIVTDGTTTKQLVFTVETEPPAKPSLQLPYNNIDTKATVQFDWGDVTDPSLPVLYDLQIAENENFLSLVLFKEGLIASQYSLTEEETLSTIAEPTTYFWRVKARDGAGNESPWSVTWSFNIAPPPVPLLLMPILDSKADMPVQFNWQAVSSVSMPVTYTLQLATDLDFTSVILEKTGLAASDYTLNEEEEEELELERETAYYWRIKAIDDANNESAWSEPSSFYINSSFHFPGWATFTLIGIAVIIVVLFAFRLGRRTAYQPPD